MRQADHEPAEAAGPCKRAAATLGTDFLSTLPRLHQQPLPLHLAAIYGPEALVLHVGVSASQFDPDSVKAVDSLIWGCAGALQSREQGKSQVMVPVVVSSGLQDFPGLYPHALSDSCFPGDPSCISSAMPLRHVFSASAAMHGACWCLVRQLLSR